MNSRLQIPNELLKGLFEAQQIVINANGSSPFETPWLEVSIGAEGHASMKLIGLSAQVLTGQPIPGQRDEVLVTQEIFERFRSTGKLPRYSAELTGLQLVRHNSKK